MSEAIAAALITGGLSFLGVLVTNLTTAKKGQASLRTAQAVTDAKLEALTREVREYNRLVQRMPVVEEQIRGIQQRVADISQRPIS